MQSGDKKPELKVLILEDDPSDSRWIKEMLIKDREVSRFHLVWCESFREAVGRLNQEKFDVLLVDLNLPDSQGLETFFQLKTECPQLPIVLLTGMPMEEEAALEAIRRGAQDYLAKSRLDSATLIRTLRYAVERKSFDRLKDEFITLVSHELRTPLTTVKSAVENLGMGLAGPLSGKQLKLVAIAHNNINRLAHIINNMLDLTCLETGLLKVRPEPVALAPLIQAVTEDFSALAAQKDVLLERELDKKLPPVLADSDLMAQVLNNLLSNALRFCRKKITVRLQKTDEGAQVSVHDDGRGIPSGRQKEIFNKFVQINRTAESGGGYQGVGLGLAICQQIVAGHGGRIWVESREGRGAQFNFILPMRGAYG